MKRESRRIVDKVRSEEARYEHGQHRPLESFAGMTAFYLAGVAVAAGVAKATDQKVPDLAPVELALLGVATHKLTRLLAKDPIASPLRAPFTRFKGTTGPAELEEEVRGTGLRKAIGELVTCPFCLAQWIATGFGFGTVFLPRTTKLIASMFTVVTISDVLQFAYSKLEQW